MKFARQKTLTEARVQGYAISIVLTYYCIDSKEDKVNQHR
jgi:DUF1365 family protein